jgi:hypothetical protein
MATLQQNATTIEIKGAAYAAEVIDPGFAGVAAVRVTRIVNPDRAYDVVLGHDGTASCECADWVCRHQDHGTHCKHIKGVVAAGLLATPAPIPSRPAVEPITRKDQVRASYWGLKLPTVPVAVQSPAPAAPIVVAVVEAAPAVEAPSEAEDGWDDDYRWELGPDAEDAPERDPAEVEPGPTLSGDAPAGMEWVLITPYASVLRSTAPDRTEARTFGPAGVEEARPTYRGGVRHTDEDEAIAAILFADNRPGSYFVVGGPMPQIGDRSFPRKPNRPRYTGTGMTDEDIYRAGAVS